MQINLPVHQAAGYEEFFNGINTLSFHHQLIVMHVEHFDDTCRANNSLAYTAVETIAAQVVEPVHIQLTRNELMQEMLVIIVGEYFQCEGEFSIIFIVHPLHHAERNLLVGDMLNNTVFECMRKRPMTNIVQQNTGTYRFGFLCSNFMSGFA